MNDIQPDTPKNVIAKKVITPTHKYFSPVHGEIEAVSLDEVVSKVNQLDKDLKTKETKVSDGR